MLAEIIKHYDDSYEIDLYNFRRLYLSNGKESFKRLSPIVHDTLVPLIYAITGTNKINDCQVNGIYENMYDSDRGTYVNAVACIDHREVKKVRENFIHALFNHHDLMKVTNITFVLENDNVEVAIPSDFIAKKEMLADVQSNLSIMIKQSIEKDNELGLMIVE